VPLSARWNARALISTKSPKTTPTQAPSDISSWYHHKFIPGSVFSPVMPTANRSTLSFQLSGIQPECSSPSSTRASSPIYHAVSRHPTSRSTSYEPLRSTFGFNHHTSPDGRAKSRGSIDSDRSRRSILSFPRFWSLAIMLGRPRKFKSANAGLLD